MSMNSVQGSDNFNSHMKPDVTIIKEKLSSIEEKVTHHDIFMKNQSTKLDSIENTLDEIKFMFQESMKKTKEMDEKLVELDKNIEKKLTNMDTKIEDTNLYVHKMFDDFDKIRINLFGATESIKMTVDFFNQIRNDPALAPLLEKFLNKYYPFIK